jgi:large subunit ribosomal protein L16
MEHSRISARQIEAMRKIIRRITKRSGLLWIKIFPHLPVTSKPSEIRMGKGKGAVAYWAAFIKKYSILIELSGISAQIAQKALQNAAIKLPFKTQIVIQKR